MTEEELDAQFLDAVERGNKMPTQTADNMLRAYAYYKQATVGNCNDPMPDNLNIVAAFKHNSWRSLYGMEQLEAKKRYIQFIEWLEKENTKS